MHAVEARGREARRRRSKLLDRAAAPDIGKPQRIARRIFQEESGGLGSNHDGLVSMLQTCGHLVPPALGQSVASIVLRRCGPSSFARRWAPEGGPMPCAYCTHVDCSNARFCLTQIGIYN